MEQDRALANRTPRAGAQLRALKAILTGFVLAVQGGAAGAVIEPRGGGERHTANRAFLAEPFCADGADPRPVVDRDVQQVILIQSQSVPLLEQAQAWGRQAVDLHSAVPQLN